MTGLTHKCKPLLAPLLLVLCLGQVMAGAASPCCLSPAGTPAVASVGHCHHAHAAGQHRAAGGMHHGAGDCCHGTGSCGMAGCVAAVALPPSFIHLDQLSPGTFTAAAREISPHYLPATLFRPPIAA